jgi:hypothetical protein
MSSSIIEVSIILVVILVIFGAILTSVENTSQKAIEATETNNMEKMLSEVVDNLINNPGVPENWNEYGKGTPGLAIVNDDGQVIANSVSYSKFIALGKDYNNLIDEKQFTSMIHSSMELQPQESSISSVKIGDSAESDNVFSLTRLVKCDFYKSYVLKDFENNGKCNKHHSQDECSCNYFKVFESNLKNSDYYLLIDDEETYDISYFVDTTRVVKDRYWQTAISDAIYLNDEIEFYDDTSAVVFVHLDKAHPKALLVSVPKNFDKSLLEYDYFRTNECELIVKAWY